MRLATFLCESKDWPVDGPAPDPDASAPEPAEVAADGNSFSLPVRLALGPETVLGFGALLWF